MICCCVFFFFRENFFQSFLQNLCASFYLISLAEKIFLCLSANHYPELWCVICTAVTFFCNGFNQSEASNFSMCIISTCNRIDHHLLRNGAEQLKILLKTSFFLDISVRTVEKLGLRPNKLIVIDPRLLVLLLYWIMSGLLNSTCPA